MLSTGTAGASIRAHTFVLSQSSTPVWSLCADIGEQWHAFVVLGALAHKLKFRMN